MRYIKPPPRILQPCFYATGIGLERYRYWAIGYWAIFTGIG